MGSHAEQLGSFDSVPLPSSTTSATNVIEMRRRQGADYGLFAQDMFSDWVKEMVASIRATEAGN